MVLDFGLTKSSSVAHSISSTKLRSLKSKKKREKKRQASSSDYCGSSSSSSDEDEGYSSSSSCDEEDILIYEKNVQRSRRGKVKKNSSESDRSSKRHHLDPSLVERMSSFNIDEQGSASMALASMLNLEYCEDEIANDHNLNVKLAADLEAELVQKQQHATVNDAEGYENYDDEEEDIESSDFLDALDEVHTRFLLNVPPEELSSSERIFFQLEQAWWYYEDLICDKLEEDEGQCLLPRHSNLKDFAERLFDFSPLLGGLDFDKLWNEFTIYKRKISTYGCILLNEDCTHVVMCKVYESNVWTFPAGKINENEIGIEAAARETYEETGFDPHCNYGLTGQWNSREEDREKHITWMHPLQDPDNMLTYVEQKSGKRRTFYVCCGVPEDYPFQPVCRKEVDKIEWVDLRDIREYETFAVLPFVGKLKKWIKRKNKSGKNNKKVKKIKKKKERKANKSRTKSRPKSREKSSTRDKQSSSRQRSSRKKDREQLVDAGLIASMGDSARWTEREMFEANSKLQGGRVVEYDGNPHLFVEKGFGIDDSATGQKRVDPHSFRVVGGSFMNSKHGDKLAEVNDAGANYQPLVRNSNEDSGLQPFFSEHGATPWGEVVDEAKSEDDEGSDSTRFSGSDGPAGIENSNRRASQDLLTMLQKGAPDKSKKSRKSKKSKHQNQHQQPISGDYDYDNSNHDDELMIFATDKEITAKRQRDHELKKGKGNEYSSSLVSPLRSSSINTATRDDARRQRLLAQYEEDMKFVHKWVANSLPNPINFKIRNVDGIIDQHCGGPGTKTKRGSIKN